MPRLRIVCTAVAATAIAMAGLASRQALADSYPASNKITVVVAFSPGGIADTLARLVAAGLSERLHQSVVVENRGGASGNIGASYVARSDPDGYTLLATTTALASNETLFEKKEFSTGDFTAIAIAAISPEALMTNPANPGNTLPEFIKAMSGKPINFAVPGIGTVSHISAEYFFKFLAKTPAQVIPFAGGAPALNAAIGNQVDMVATTLGGGAAAQLAAGKLKGLGIAADKQVAAAPNVPTYAEQGYPGFTAATWVGFFAPAKTDPQIVATLNAAINAIVATPDVQTKLATMGFDPLTSSPAEVRAMFDAEVKKWGDRVKALGLTIQ
jgi:tripartite-type tricarboxylate transporter receptor subunit TctC